MTQLGAYNIFHRQPSETSEQRLARSESPCVACREKTRHAPADWLNHLERGTGIQDGVRWDAGFWKLDDSALKAKGELWLFGRQCGK